MHISISGKGTAIVFIHGYCETSAIWSDFEQDLSGHFQVILLDLPGHGKSPLIANDFTIEDIADQVYDTLCANDIDQFFVIGHSLGGYVSLALAELYPDNVLGFGLFSSTTFADDEEKKKVRDKVKYFIEEHGVLSFIESFIPNLFAAENKKRLQKDIDQMIIESARTPAESIIGYAMAMKNRPDRTYILAKFDKPVFIIAGERDMAVRFDASEKMMSYLHKNNSLMLRDTGHNGFLERPSESISFISNFLRDNFQ